MKTLLHALEATALVALIAALLGAIAIERTVRNALPGILNGSGEAVAKLSLASDALARAANAESKAAPQQTREVSKAVADAHDLLAHTDISLNGPHGLIPQLSASVADQQSQADAIEAQARQALADLDAAERQSQEALKAITGSAQAAQDAISGPQLTQTLSNLAIASQEADSALKSLDSIAASGNRDAAMLEARLRQALKPATLAKSILMHLLGIAGPGAQVYSAAH